MPLGHAPFCAHSAVEATEGRPRSNLQMRVSILAGIQHTLRAMQPPSELSHTLEPLRQRGLLL